MQDVVQREAGLPRQSGVGDQAAELSAILEARPVRSRSTSNGARLEVADG